MNGENMQGLRLCFLVWKGQQSLRCGSVVFRAYILALFLFPFYGILHLSKSIGGNCILDKFIPYDKRSKKKKREHDLLQRHTWGPLNPVTRNTGNPKAYNRAKARKWKSDDYPTVLFVI